MQDWAGLSADERRLYARMMEVFAGFLEHTDHHIGRLLDFLAAIGELDDTLIMVLSDNGASAEGGPSGSVNENKFFNFVPDSLEQNLAAIDDIGGPKYFNHYPWGWTWAGNTPFRRWKRETYRGGISDPFIVQWTNGIAARGEVRTQYAHAIDMVPTVLDTLGVEAPAAIRGVTQAPIEGVSFAHTFDDAAVASNHVTQYFEMLGHRSIYHDGWRAVCPWPGTSFTESGRQFGTPIPAATLTELDATGWELYHVAEDFAENHNIAETNRAKLIEMIAQWYVEAGKYNVLPVDGRGQQRFADPRPVIATDRSRYIYFPGTQEVSASAAPKILNRPHTITALVDIPDGGAEGVLVSQGGVDGGFTFYLRDARLHYTYNYVADQRFQIVGDVDVPAGRHALSFEFEPTAEPQPMQGKGITRGRQAVHRRHPGRPGRTAGHHPAHSRSRLRGVRRRRRRLTRHRRVPHTVRIHRHHRTGRLRRLRQEHRRPRSRNPPSPRPPIDDRASMTTRERRRFESPNAGWVTHARVLHPPV